MSTKKKSTNSLTELLEKSKHILTDIYIPDNQQQIIDETKILRPYLEPNNSNQSTHIDHISTTYRPHIDHRIDHISTTYRPHIDHISTTKNEHIDHISTTESTTESTTKITCIESEKNFSSLSKVQKKILIYIYNSCKQLLSKISACITVDEFSICCNLKKKSIKTTLKRLEENKIITLRAFKRGRQGWRKYEISEKIYQEILLIGFSEFKSTTESTTESTTSSHIVSSYINNKLLTTTALPEEYKNLDLSCLANIGFDESHIIQIHREYTKKPEMSLSAEIIQNSINAFAFDLKHNNVANDFKSSPAVVLTYLLKKGQPYSSKTPEKVLTPQEEAMQEYLLAQEKKQQKISEIKTRARELALQEWLDSLSEEELLNFNQELRPDGIPDRIYQKSRRKKAEELAKDYFDTVLWPKQLKQILNQQPTLNATEPQL